jgi:hypothetical protein
MQDVDCGGWVEANVSSSCGGEGGAVMMSYCRWENMEWLPRFNVTNREAIQDSSFAALCGDIQVSTFQKYCFIADVVSSTENTNFEVVGDAQEPLQDKPSTESIVELGYPELFRIGTASETGEYSGYLVLSVLPTLHAGTFSVYTADNTDPDCETASRFSPPDFAILLPVGTTTIKSAECLESGRRDGGPATASRGPVLTHTFHVSPGPFVRFQVQIKPMARRGDDRGIVEAVKKDVILSGLSKSFNLHRR